MKKIAYFKIYNENEEYAGGVMIADERGIPIEFKYTEPVKPTKVQKVLYGEVLDKYLREEVIMANLLSKLENRPEIFIIDDIENIYLKNIVKEDVVLVKKTQINPFKEVGAYKFVKEDEAIVQIKEGQKPIRIIIDEKNKDAILDSFLQVVLDIDDILEPIERIKEALKLICKGEL